MPCPNCRNPRKEAPIQRIVRNSLNALKFNCPVQCGETFKYEQKEQHLSECVNKNEIESRCSLCDKILHDSLKNHSRSCEKLVTKCLFCNVILSKFDLKEHLKECKDLKNFCNSCSIAYPNIFEKAHSEYFCKKIKSLKKQIADFMQIN